jgi:hypothetical protein
MLGYVAATGHFGLGPGLALVSAACSLVALGAGMLSRAAPIREGLASRSADPLR